MENAILGWMDEPVCAVSSFLRERLEQRHSALLSAARQQLHSPTMTAIVGIETAEGFVLGADGLTVNQHNQEICAHTQKIFFAAKPREYSFA
jgi:hypothetical protein